MEIVAFRGDATHLKALLAGEVDASGLMGPTGAIMAASKGARIRLWMVPDPVSAYRLVARKSAAALIEANRFIAANKAGTVKVMLKVVPEETPEVLGRAYDITDPRLWGVNGDLAEAAYRYTVDLLMKAGHMQAPAPFEKLFDRRFVDQALKELGRM